MKKTQEYIRLSNIATKKGELKEAIRYINKAIVNLKDDTENEGIILLLKCLKLYDYDLRTNYKKIRELLLYILEKHKSDEMISCLASVFLEEIYFLRRDFENFFQMRKSVEEIIEVDKQFKYKNEIKSYHYYILSSYQMRNNKVKSIEYIIKAINICNYKPLLIRYHIQYSRIIYEKDKDKANKIILFQLNIIEKEKIDSCYFPAHDLLLEIYFTLACNYWNERKIDLSLYYLNKSLMIAQNTQSKEMIAECLMFKTLLLSTQQSKEEFNKQKREALLFCKSNNNYQDLVLDIESIEYGR